MNALLLALSATLPTADLPPVQGQTAAFTITDAVTVAQPARFGANMHPPQFTHWGEEPFNNQWWGCPNPNPIETRLKLLATGGGADFIDCVPEKAGGVKGSVGMGFYDVFRDGFFDGGEVWVWRYADGKASVVRQGRILAYRASATGANRITLEPGPAVQAGDEFVIRVVRHDVPAGATRTMAGQPHVINRLQILDAAQKKAFIEAKGTMDIAAEAPPGGGGGSLRIQVPGGAVPTAIGYWLLSNQQADWPRFRAGARYRLSFWARQDGLSSPVQVQVASLATASIAVQPTWTEHVIEFTGAPPTGGAEPLNWTIASPGTLLLDRITIHEVGDTAPGAFWQPVVDTLRRYRPSTLRLWALQCNKGFGRSLDAGLGPVDEANLEMTETQGGITTDATDLHQQLALCAQVGTEPWIVMSTMFSPQEYRNLMEYLAGAPDTPYGAKRAARGQVKPWTEVFPRIGLELGNETWNGMFAPQGFAGRAKEYGQFADLVFRTCKATPGYDPARFRLILNGWVAGTTRKWGYGPIALEQCPSADATDLAYYTGGWDAVGLIKADSPQWGWFNILTYSYRMLRPRAEEYATTVRTIAAERQRPVEVLVYEAGPGYTLPGPGKFDLAEQREGKSMAQAVNALDIFMTNLANGFGDQSFFLFRNGHYWSSHNRQWGEHIAWKALGLRNTQLTGDRITATPTAMPTIDLPEAEAVILNQSNSAQRSAKKFPPMAGVPLIACHPFKDGGRYATMLYSRRIDAITPVTITLPVEPKPTMRLYRLAADPAAHNIDREEVTVQEETRNDAAQTFTIDLPPASVVVVVNEAR